MTICFIAGILLDHRQNRWRFCHNIHSSSSKPIEKIIWNKFYIYGSVHRWSILIIVQRDATQSNLFIILQIHSTRFRCQTHPSSGVHKTVTTAFGTAQLLCSYFSPTWSSWPGWKEVARQKMWLVPKAVVTVLCTPADGCVYRNM